MIAQPDKAARGYKGRWIAQKAASRYELGVVHEETYE